MEKKTIYTIANAHLDTIWSWDFEKTVGTYLKRTLDDNFSLFQKYPQYNFNFEGAYRYELMHEYYPEKFEKMKEYIAKGRWNVCGSAYENGDVNVPSPEALFRNILLGNNYFYDNFNKKSVDIFLPDCFGFGYALPSIMHHANLKGFTTQKLTWGSAYGVPFDIGKWYGVDGNYVYACTNPGRYDRTLTKVRDDSIVANKLEENCRNGLNMTCVFHGTGDRGGAPHEISVKTVSTAIKKNKSCSTEVLSCAADKIYHDIEKLSDDTKQRLPVWNNELVMQNHGAGGYTSRAIGKRLNRQCEEIADMAERASVTALYIGGHPYPYETLKKAWKRFIAHQFHDDLPGTSVQRAYRRTWNDYFLSLNQFTNEYSASVKSISKRLDTSKCQGVPVIINNPMEYERTSVTEVKVPANLSYSRMVCYDMEGNEYPTQIKDRKKDGTTVLICATVPPFGYKVFDLRKGEPKKNSHLSISENQMENEKYIVKLNSNGDIKSIFDKEIKKEILNHPIETGIFDYKGSSSWPAWELNYKEINRHPQHIAKLQNKSIAENGSCRVGFKIVKSYKDSIFTSFISLSAGGKCVEVRTETEWRSRESLCKEIFSFNAENHNATFDLGLGAIKRGNMNEKLFEVPAQKWADISDSEKDFGVSVISECKYGWDKFDDRTLRLTILHTPQKNYRIDSMQSMMDLGLNRYSYAIYSHKGAVSHETQVEARNFIMPTCGFTCSNHEGNLGYEFSFGKLEGNGILRAMKKAEYSDEIVVRVGEGEKKHQKDVALIFARPIESVREIYASEEHIVDIPVTDGKLIFDLKPYEIRSFAITMKKDIDKPIDEVTLIYSGNCDAYSSNKKPTSAIPKIEKSIPLELVPEEIYTNGVRFRIDKSKKAILCGGQTLILPHGTKKVHFLAASLNGDKLVNFGGRRVLVNDIKEYIGGWDLYDFKEVAFGKTGKLAYEFTHSHTKNGDAQCEQLFFWKVTVPVGDATSLTLPADSDILILAATADSDTTICRHGTELYDTVKDRTFTYKMNALDMTKYLWSKEPIMLNDKGNALKNRNLGKKK